MTRLNTPAGKPARLMISASAQALPGTRSAGLMTTQLPYASAGRDLPGRNGDRKIPGRDQADHTQRLARDFHADAGAHRGQQLARLAQAFAGEEPEDVAGARGLADRLGQGLALLAREQVAQLLAARQDLAGDAVRARRCGPGCRTWTTRERRRARRPPRHSPGPHRPACTRPPRRTGREGLMFGAAPGPARHSPAMKFRCHHLNSPSAARGDRGVWRRRAGPRAPRAAWAGTGGARPRRRSRHRPS